MLAPDTHLKDRYRILHQIGRGGFGTVYKAVDEVFGCSVAIKETKEEVVNHEKLKKAFEREAKLLRNLKHECLPRVSDYFLHENTQFLVMDFIEGEDLGALLKRRLATSGPFTVAEVLPLADRILGALEYLHSLPEPIIHRDIKPANIKLGSDGGIYLLDFGLAKGTAGQMSTMLEGQSSFSIAAFTHEYAPLEQLQGLGTQPQSDIYAFGATLYHLLTGQIPIAASKRDEAIQRSHGDPLRPACEANPMIPERVSKVIEQAMIVRWWDRLASAKEMRLALGDAWEGVVGTKLMRNGQALSAIPTERFSTEKRLMNGSDTPTPLKSGSPTVPTQAVLKSHRLRRQFVIGSLALVLVATMSGGGWLALKKLAPAAGPKIVANNADSESSKLSLPNTLNNLQIKRNLPGHSGTVWSIAFSRDGSCAASASDNGSIILWDTKTWSQKPPRLAGHGGPVYSVAFSPDNKLLASASEDKTIRLWNTDTGEFTELPQGEKPVFRVAFLPDDRKGNVLISVSGEPISGGDRISIWDSNGGWQLRVLPFNSTGHEVYAIATSPDGTTLAAAGKGSNIQLWNMKSLPQKRELSVPQSPKAFISRLAFSPDGKYLAAGNSQGEIKLWEAEGWKEAGPLETLHKKVITAIAFSPDNMSFVSASSDGTVRLWNVLTGSSRLLKTFDEIPQSLAFSPDGQTLLIGGTKQFISVWQ